MRQRAADNVGMTDQRDGHRRVAPAQDLHQGKHPGLNLDHQLATGNARAATQRIKISPLGDVTQVVEALPGPFAIIDLVELRCDRDSLARKLRQELCGLPRSWLGTAVDFTDPQLLQGTRQALALNFAGSVQMHVRIPAGKTTWNAIGGSVPDKDQPCHGASQSSAQSSVNELTTWTVAGRCVRRRSSQMPRMPAAWLAT